MKIKYTLPFLMLSLLFFTGCVDKITRKVAHNTKTIEYKVEKEELKKNIAAIFPAQDVNLTTSVTKVDDDPEFNTIHLEIKDPEEFPQNGMSFKDDAEALKEEVSKGISNIDDFQKMKITVKRIKVEEGTEHEQKFTKEFDL